MPIMYRLEQVNARIIPTYETGIRIMKLKLDETSINWYNEVN